MEKKIMEISTEQFLPKIVLIFPCEQNRNVICPSIPVASQMSQLI